MLLFGSGENIAAWGTLNYAQIQRGLMKCASYNGWGV